MGFLVAWFGRLFPFLAGWIPGLHRVLWGAKVVLRIGIIVALLALIPLPDWVDDLPGRLADLSPSIGYFAGLIQLRFGVAVVFGSLALRFMWREISKSV